MNNTFRTITFVPVQAMSMAFGRFCENDELCQHGVVRIMVSHDGCNTAEIIVDTVSATGMTPTERQVINKVSYGKIFMRQCL